MTLSEINRLKNLPNVNNEALFYLFFTTWLKDQKTLDITSNIAYNKLAIELSNKLPLTKANEIMEVAIEEFNTFNGTTLLS